MNPSKELIQAWLPVVGRYRFKAARFFGVPPEEVTCVDVARLHSFKGIGQVGASSICEALRERGVELKYPGDME